LYSGFGDSSSEVLMAMSSTVGLRGWQGLGAFVAATHGVIGLTESGALDYADREIRINAIAAGSVMTDRIGALPEEQRAPIAQGDPDAPDRASRRGGGDGRMTVLGGRRIRHGSGDLG
jgi:NAD(P)-dependent dehydrogenase (short-subunit alcohol dehydrogenase family)